MVTDWVRLYKARKWMKRNEQFLPTWHAYLGFTLHLFEYFRKAVWVEDIAKKHQLNTDLLRRWVEVGIAIGHLKEDKLGRIQTKRKMLHYFTRDAKHSIGPLIREMMELHIPTLLSYRDLLKGSSEIHYKHEEYGGVIAETSSILEKIIFPKLSRWIGKKNVKSLIDLGCGNGGYLERIKKKHPKLDLMGIEMDRTVAETAAARFNETEVNIVEKDIRKLNTNTLEADMVLMNNIIYYFSKQERDFLFEKVNELLKEKGYAVLTTPINEELKRKPFSTAFNSFMSANKNLSSLPTEKEILKLAKRKGFNLRKKWLAIREGSWYIYIFQKATN